MYAILLAAMFFSQMMSFMMVPSLDLNIKIGYN